MPIKDGYYWYTERRATAGCAHPMIGRDDPDPALVKLDGTQVFWLQDWSAWPTPLLEMRGEWWGPIVVPDPTEETFRAPITEECQVEAWMKRRGQWIPGAEPPDQPGERSPEWVAEAKALGFDLYKIVRAEEQAARGGYLTLDEFAKELRDELKRRHAQAPEES